MIAATLAGTAVFVSGVAAAVLVVSAWIEFSLCAGEWIARRSRISAGRAAVLVALAPLIAAVAVLYGREVAIILGWV
jgi:hypothetical protein